MIVSFQCISLSFTSLSVFLLLAIKNEDLNTEFLDKQTSAVFQVSLPPSSLPGLWPSWPYLDDFKPLTIAFPSWGGWINQNFFHCKWQRHNSSWLSSKREFIGLYYQNVQAGLDPELPFSLHTPCVGFIFYSWLSHILAEMAPGIQAYIQPAQQPQREERLFFMRFLWTKQNRNESHWMNLSYVPILEPVTVVKKMKYTSYQL